MNVTFQRYGLQSLLANTSFFVIIAALLGSFQTLAFAKESVISPPQLISAGNYHVCAITKTRAAKCWGANVTGQLGNGNTTNSTSPVDVVGLSQGVNAISVNYFHSCAIVGDSGAAMCWGSNGDGELGNNGTVNSLVPTNVVGLSSGGVAIATGRYHTCALTVSGGVKCWGSNVWGQLGNNSLESSSVPIDVIGLTGNVIAIGAGEQHTCAVTTTGAVKCWGSNSVGQLGVTKSLTQSQTPIDVTGLNTGATTVALGSTVSCVVMTTGSAKCWGENYQRTVNSFQPTEVVGLSSAKSISVNMWEICASTVSGAGKCWGANGFGELGNNSTVSSPTPVDVFGLSSGVKTISAGDQFACAIDSADAAKCWGTNEGGQLGNGNTLEAHIPTEVINFSDLPLPTITPTPPIYTTFRFLPSVTRK